MWFLFFGFALTILLFIGTVVCAYVAHLWGPRGNAGLILLKERETLESVQAERH